MHIRRAMFGLLALLVLLPLTAAYLQWAIAGLPAISLALPVAVGPHRRGFPRWLRVTQMRTFFSSS